MKHYLGALLGLILPVVSNAQTALPPVRNLIPEQSVNEVFQGVTGAFVVIDCKTGETFKVNPIFADQANVPCSTFKIWNTLIGLEEGHIKGPDVPFYKWDGVARTITDWNKDLTLREAFRVSCVPAFQELARKVGPMRMKEWIDKLNYGNKDLSAGVDTFWLPKAGRSNICISPTEQAALIRLLLNGKLAVKRQSVSTLREVMRTEVSPMGTLYGKTGSGVRFSIAKPTNDVDMGWFVGFLEHGGREYAYACIVLGPSLSGKDAKRLVETVFKKNKML